MYLIIHEESTNIGDICKLIKLQEKVRSCTCQTLNNSKVKPGTLSLMKP